MMRFAFILFSMVAVFTPAQGFLWFKKAPDDRSPAQQTALAQPIFDKALAAEQAGSTRRALAGYKKVYKRYPASELAGRSLYNTALIHYRRQNWKKSFESFQSILAFHPSFPQFNELVEYQFRIALANAEAEGVRFAWVIPYRALNRAVGYFEVVITNAPYSELAPIALMNVALIHQYKGQIPEAIDALDRLINSYPSSLLALDAYLSLAETFATLVQGPEYDQGATREAISYFEDFLILFSDSMEVARAEKGLGEMRNVYSESKLVIGAYYYNYRRWFQAAEIFFNEAITLAPESAAAAEARTYIARIAAIREGRTLPEAEENSPERLKEKSFIRRWMGRVLPG